MTQLTKLHSPVKSIGGDRPNQRIFLDHLDRKMSHVAWSWRGVICGEMVGIERQLDTITFISPRVVAQPGRPPDGCNGPHKNKSCYMLPWWPASPIAFQRLSSSDASILKILYDVQWRELKGTTTYIFLLLSIFLFTKNISARYDFRGGDDIVVLYVYQCSKKW